MNKIIVLLCGLALLPMSAVSAEIYKWKDTDGKVRYSDLPPPGKIPYEMLTGKKPAAARASTVEASSGDSKATKAAAVSDKELDAKKRKAEEDGQKKKEQEKLDTQKVREHNCETAKSNLQNYKAGGRIYKIDEKGERKYLEQNDITAGLDSANKEVEQWCN